MAGSSSLQCRMEKVNNAAIGEQQHLLFNMEVMKHFSQQTRDNVRNTMLRHEKIFQNQVHELHRLYKVQKMLMNEANCRASEYLSTFPLGLHSTTKNLKQIGNKRSLWESTGGSYLSYANDSGMPPPMEALMSEIQDLQGLVHHTDGKSGKEMKKKLDDRPGCKSTSVRKKTIDLEQPPDDDTEDETEIFHAKELISEKNSVQFSPRALSLIQKENDTGLDLSQCLDIEKCNRPAYALERSKERNVVMEHAWKADTSSCLERLDDTSSPLSSQGYAMLPRKFSSIHMPPGEEADLSTGSTSLSKEATTSSSQQRTQVSSLQAEVDPTTYSFHSKQSVGLPKETHLHKTEQACNEIDKQHEVFAQRTPQEVNECPQQGFQHHVLQRNIEGSSRWFPQVVYTQGYQIETALPAGVQVRGPEGQSSFPAQGLVIPTIGTSSKGSIVDSDFALWYPPNSYLQFPRYQYPAAIQAQARPSDNQIPWLQSAQIFHGGLYPQQPIYRMPAGTTSQLGFSTEVLWSQGGVSMAPWHAVGGGPQYSNLPPIPHSKPPFRTHPKLVLTSRGNCMDLKPDKEIGELVSLSTSTKESIQEASELQDENSKLLIDETKICNSTEHPIAEMKGQGSDVMMQSNHESELNYISLGARDLSKMASMGQNVSSGCPEVVNSGSLMAQNRGLRGSPSNENSDCERAQISGPSDSCQLAQYTETIISTGEPKVADQNAGLRLEVPVCNQHSADQQGHLSGPVQQQPVQCAALTGNSSAEQKGSIQGDNHNKTLKDWDHSSDFVVQGLQKRSESAEDNGVETMCTGQIVPLLPDLFNIEVENSTSEENKGICSVSEGKEKITKSQPEANDQCDTGNANKNLVPSGDRCQNVGGKQNIQVSALLDNGCSSSACGDDVQERNSCEVEEKCEINERSTTCVEENTSQLKLQPQAGKETSTEGILSRSKLLNISALRKKTKPGKVFKCTQETFISLERDGKSFRNVGQQNSTKSGKNLNQIVQVNHSQEYTDVVKVVGSRSDAVKDVKYGLNGYQKKHKVSRSTAIRQNRAIESKSGSVAKENGKAVFSAIKETSQEENTLKRGCSECSTTSHTNQLDVAISKTEEISTECDSAFVHLSLVDTAHEGSEDVCDNASLAASILLSFAPKACQNEKSTSKGDNKTLCERPLRRSVENVGNRTRQLATVHKADASASRSVQSPAKSTLDHETDMLSKDRTQPCLHINRQTVREVPSKRLAYFESATLILMEDSNKKQQASDLQSDGKVQEQQKVMASSLSMKDTTVDAQGSAPSHSAQDKDMHFVVLRDNERRSIYDTTPSNNTHEKSNIRGSTDVVQVHQAKGDIPRSLRNGLRAWGDSSRRRRSLHQPQDKLHNSAKKTN